MTYLKFRSSEALGITYYEKALANMMLVLKLVQVDDHEQSVMCKQSNTAGINQIFFYDKHYHSNRHFTSMLFLRSAEALGLMYFYNCALLHQLLVKRSFDFRKYNAVNTIPKNVCTLSMLAMEVACHEHLWFKAVHLVSFSN